MGLGNNPGDDNRPKDGQNKNGKGEGHDKHPANGSQSSDFDGVTLPDLGEKIGEGHYVASVGDDVVSAGNINVHEMGLIGEHVIDGDTLRMMGITDKDGAFRALKGDSGSSKTSAGYTPKYAKGWDSAFGPKPSSN